MARSMPNGTLAVDQIARYPQDYPQIKERKIMPRARDLKPNANGPNVLGLEWLSARRVIPYSKVVDGRGRRDVRAWRVLRRPAHRVALWRALYDAIK